MTLLQNLFVALIIPFSYENKRFAQHWTTHNWRIHWPAMAFMTQNMHLCRTWTY